MTAFRRAALALLLGLIALSTRVVAVGGAGTAYDWSTYGFDVQRSGYNSSELALGVANAGSLHKLWSFDLGAVTITQPVIASNVLIAGTMVNVLYAGSEHGDFYALNADTGQLIWHRNLGSVTTGCSDMPDNIFGVGGTATFDRSADAVYVAGGNGNIYALTMETGADLVGWPVVGVFNPSQLSVYGGLTLTATHRLYVTTASHCDIPPYRGMTADVDIARRKVVAKFFPSGSVTGGGIWGPGGASVDPSTGHVFVATGNAQTTPENFRYSDAVVELGASLSVLGFNKPQLSGGDVDFGATPILYQAPACPAQLAAKNKSGVLFVYSRGHLSSGPTQRLQIADVNHWLFNGIPAYSPVSKMLYVSNSSDSSAGTYRHGLVALSVLPDCTLGLAWQATVGLNLTSVSPPTVANGVVYFGDGPANTMFAFDAQTGLPLWNSGSTIAGPIFAAPSVVNGKLYVGAWDHNLYAFGP